MILSQNYLFSTRFKFKPTRVLNNMKLSMEKLYVFQLKKWKLPPRPEPWRIENPTLAFGLSARFFRRRLLFLVHHQRRNRRKSPRLKLLGMRPKKRASYNDGVVIARCRRRRSGEPVRWVLKPFVTRVGFDINPVGFFRSIDRLVAQLSAVKFIPIATVKCWRWGRGKEWLDRNPVYRLRPKWLPLAESLLLD